MRRFGSAFIALTLVLLLGSVAQAGIIYNNGGPNQQNGNEMTNWIQAENFMLGSTNTITDVHFWTIEDPNANGFAGSIWYGIYDDIGGQPGNLVGGGGFATLDGRTFVQGGILGHFDEYAYDLTISPFVALAGTNYWLALHNGLLSNTARAEVYWEWTNPNATATGQEMFLPGTTWSGNGGEHAFYLTGANVPDPGSSLLLLGMGLVGLRAWKKRLE
jgi:hypothetical protein